jgi:hypothetical protein
MQYASRPSSEPQERARESGRDRESEERDGSRENNDNPNKLITYRFFHDCMLACFAMRCGWVRCDADERWGGEVERRGGEEEEQNHTLLLLITQK